MIFYTFLCIITFYAAVVLGKTNPVFYGVVLVLIAAGRYGLPYIQNKDPREYIESEKIAFTQKTSYGVYALVFFIVFSIAVAIYLNMTKLN